MTFDLTPVSYHKLRLIGTATLHVGHMHVHAMRILDSHDAMGHAQRCAAQMLAHSLMASQT